MSKTPKILFVLLIILFVLILGELGYYFLIQNGPQQKALHKNPPQPLSKIDSQKASSISMKKDPLISNYPLSKIDSQKASSMKKDPLMSNYNCCFLDSKTNKTFAKVFLDDYEAKKSKMAADFGSWNDLVFFPKNATEKLVVESQTKGKIAGIDPKAIINGKKVYQMRLSDSTYFFPQSQLSKVEVVAIVNGKESKKTLADLKEGALVSVYLKTDLTKEAADDNSLLSAKIMLL